MVSFVVESSWALGMLTPYSVAFPFSLNQVNEILESLVAEFCAVVVVDKGREFKEYITELFDDKLELNVF